MEGRPDERVCGWADERVVGLVRRGGAYTAGDGTQWQEWLRGICLTVFIVPGERG